MALVFAVCITGGVACSSSSESSPAGSGSNDMCADVAATQQAFEDLKNVDIVSSGTDGLRSALDSVKTSLQALESSASATLSAQVAAVKTAVSSLESSISSLDSSDLGSAQAEIQPEVTALESAIGDLGDNAGSC
jgi:hypothetical protein